MGPSCLGFNPVQARRAIAPPRALRFAGRSKESITAFREYHSRNPGFGLADIVMIQGTTQ